jgi:hypothetical protein
VKKPGVLRTSGSRQTHSEYADRRDELTDCIIGANRRIESAASGIESMAGSLKIDGADQLAILQRILNTITECEHFVRAKLDYEKLLELALLDRMNG